MPRFTAPALAALALVPALALAAAPANAARPGVDQFGKGTWTAATAGVDLTGATTGKPVSGATVGAIAANDGTLPPWSGCEPGSGSLTTTGASGEVFTVALTGNLCASVAPTGYLSFIGWYDVTSYTGGKGRKAATGRGSVDLRVNADGTAQWMLSGELR